MVALERIIKVDRDAVEVVMVSGGADGAIDGGQNGLSRQVGTVFADMDR